MKQKRRPSRKVPVPAPAPPAPQGFDPVPVRARHDGWTAQRQVDFIRALGETVCVAEACARVGLSERSAYTLRARPDAISFRNAWDAALDYGVRRLGDAALSRSLNGVAVPVFFQGQQIGERRYYDERLTMFLLRYRDPVRFGKWRDREEAGGHPERAAARFAISLGKTRQDADLPSDQVPARYLRRAREIAQEHFDEDPEAAPYDEEEGDVA